jgi:hypothetical protein
VIASPRAHCSFGGFISASWTLTGSSSAAAPPCIAAAAASASAPRAAAGLVATKVRIPAAPSTPVALKPL